MLDQLAEWNVGANLNKEGMHPHCNDTTCVMTETMLDQRAREPILSPKNLVSSRPSASKTVRALAMEKFKEMVNCFFCAVFRIMLPVGGPPRQWNLCALCVSHGTMEPMYICAFQEQKSFVHEIT